MIKVRNLSQQDSKKELEKTFQSLAPGKIDNILPFSEVYIYVAEKDNRIIGTATLVVDYKMIHNGGMVGRIEDVSVTEDEMGNGVGSALVEYCVSEAVNKGVYKVILCCKPELEEFYSRLGFHRSGFEMRMSVK